MNLNYKFRYFALSILFFMAADLIAKDDDKLTHDDEVNDQVFFSSDFRMSANNLNEIGVIKDGKIGEADSWKTVPDCQANVSRYTGMSQVEIPLYSATQRGVPLDVRLRYNSDGIKVNSLPSWTGYEWKLNAGGMITRVVQGNCDEIDNGFFFVNYSVLKMAEQEIKTLPGHAIWESIYQRLDGLSDYSPDIFYFSFFGKSGRFFFGQDQQWHVLSGSNLFIDFNVNDSTNYTEPYFLYNGYEDDGSQNTRLKTKKLQRKTIKGFTIVDEEGTKYVFGNKERRTSPTDTTMSFNHRGACNIEYSIPLRNLHADTLSKAPTMRADTWYLTEVIDRFGEVLYEFEYERGEFIVDVRPNIHSEVVTAVMNEHGKFDTTGFHVQIPNYRNLDSLRSYYANLNSANIETRIGQKQKEKKPLQCPYDFRVISPVYLKKINMPGSGDSIIFSRSGERDAITSEILYPSLYRYCQSTDLNGFLCKLYGFTAIKGARGFSMLLTTSDSITPFHSVYSRENYVRKSKDPLYSMAIRTLKDISIYRKGIRLKKYELSYTDSGRKLMSGVQVREGKKSAGNYQFQYCLPEAIPVDVLCTFTDTWGYYAGNNEARLPKKDSTMCGMLVSVKNPLGSVIELSYSQNQYSRYRSDDRSFFYHSGGLAGGLRVSRITTFRDADKQDTLSSVRYEYSGGELFALPKQRIEHEQRTPSMFASYDYNRIRVEFFNYNCVLPYRNAYGEHIGYSKVTERYRNGVHKTFTYSNLSSHTDSTALLCSGMTDAFGELDYKRGQLQKEELYDENNKLVQKSEYIYRSDNTEKNYVLAGNLVLNAIEYKDTKNFPTTYVYYTGSIYKMFYPKYDIVETRTTTYEQDGSITDVVSFLKNDYNLAIGNAKVDVRKCVGNRMRRDTLSLSMHESYSYESLNDTNFLHQFYLPLTKTERRYEKRIEIPSTGPIYTDPNVNAGSGHPLTDENGHRLYVDNQEMVSEVSYADVPISFISGEQTCFMAMVSRNGVRTMVPEKVMMINTATGKAGLTTKAPEVKFLTYHGDGQPEKYQEKGKPVSRVFFDKEDRIVAKVTSTADLSGMVWNEDASVPEELITLNAESVFNLPCTEAIVYRYNELGWIESATIGRGMTVHYRYDNIGRLVEERDAQGRVLKRYTYNISYK